MYCSSCGAAVPQGLSYCNRCGVELNTKDSLQPQRAHLIAAIVFVTVGGLGVLTGLSAVLMGAFDHAQLLAVVFLGFLLILGLDLAFLWLLLDRKKGAKESELREIIRREVGDARTHALPEPAFSVTENTTRTLDHAAAGHETE